MQTQTLHLFAIYRIIHNVPTFNWVYTVSYYFKPSAKLFVGDCARKVTGDGRFRKLCLYVKLTDNAEFYDNKGNDTGNLNSSRKLFSRTKQL